MKIFGWKSTGRAFARPAKTRVALARTYGTYSLGEWPRNYEAQVREGYLHNAIAQRAVRLVAEGVAAAPLTASDPAALALVKATSGGQALIETVAVHLLLHGNAYVELLTGADGQPCELYALRPERVSVEADARGWPVAFVYRAGEAATRIELLDWQSPAAATTVIEAVVGEGAQRFDRPARALDPAHFAPNSLAIRHYEPARDFQSGIQRSQRSAAGRTSRQADLPAAVDGAAALRLADMQLLQAQRERDSWTGYVSIGIDNVHPGDWITDDAGARWRITELEHLRGSIKVTARAWTESPSQSSPAFPGRSISTPDVLAGATRLVLVDLPVLDLVDPGKPQMAVFAAGTAQGWRRAALSVVQGDGLIDIGPTAAPAVIGTALSALPPHNPNLIDMHNHLDIQLLHEGMALPSGTGSPLSGGAGLCWLENEFFRYGSGVAMGNGRFRLSQLLRGCHASEGEIAGHETGERFVLLENDSGRLVQDITLLPGMALSVEALGLGDVSPVAATRTVQGHAIRPPPPVHGQVAHLADGSICVGWVRRTRIDAGWNDGVDQAIVEDIEQYHVSISGNGLALANRTVETPMITLTSAELTIFDLPPSTTLTFDIRQIGRFALSEKLALTAAIFS